MGLTMPWMLVAFAAAACPTSGSVRVFGPARSQWVAAVRAAAGELAPEASPFAVKLGKCAKASRCVSLQLSTAESLEDSGDFDLLIDAESPETALVVTAMVRAPGRTDWMSDYQLAAVGWAGIGPRPMDIATWATSTITGGCGKTPW